MRCLICVTKRANLAHGAVFAFSGQILVLGATTGYNVLWMTLPAALAFGALSSAVLTGIVLMVFAWTIIPRFIDRAPNMMITITLGIAIVLMEGARIGADTRDYWLPPLLNAQTQLFPMQGAPTLTALQLINIFTILLVIVAAEAVLRRTSAGRALRAVSDDPQAANLCGTDAANVRRNAVLAGGVLAALGGMLATLYFGNMSFGAGLTYGLKVLFITSAGGGIQPVGGICVYFIHNFIGTGPLLEQCCMHVYFLAVILNSVGNYFPLPYWALRIQVNRSDKKNDR